ncbi:hypothetical protein VTN00DRAFT_8987 [Thermoascus crustaceus]|uniref:uncharacterized protein n=1 Tax=Thermoascus crustaceus TaxID=5088 RepID=UPI0037429903
MITSMLALAELKQWDSAHPRSQRPPATPEVYPPDRASQKMRTGPARSAILHPGPILVWKTLIDYAVVSLGLPTSRDHSPS